MNCTALLASLISMFTGMMVGLVAGRGDPKHPFFWGGVTGVVIGIICGIGITYVIFKLERKFAYTRNPKNRETYSRFYGILYISSFFLGPALSAALSGLLADKFSALLLIWR